MSNQGTSTPKSIQEKEEEILAFWNENKIFEKSIETPAGSVPKGDYSFYDGPPFATGLPHHGHILAGTIKDAIPRYQTMNGKSVRRVWGWDCHGLPVENIIEKELNLGSKKDIEEYGIGKFNEMAQASVFRFEEEWKKIIPRLGRFVDMDRPYATMNSTYTESVWWAWSELYKKGLAYEGNKMMHICPRCETTLAQSEVGMNYEDITDLSVTAKFELVDEPNTFVLAWTTTPWTLPGNVALAIHKEAEYVKVNVSEMDGHYILGKELSTSVLKDKQYEVIATISGEDLVGKSYKPLFPYYIDKEIEHKENIWKIWHAYFITLDTGTGIAHEAPAFGEEDMQLAKANNIPIIKHVLMDGTFTSDVTDFAGMKVKKAGDSQSADIEIIKWLAHNGKLFEKHKIIHSYPLCWRCKTPLLNYATSSWFVDVPKLKPRLLEENSKIGWTPSHVRDGRFGKWLEGAREWAVSRARFWGAPLPVWKNKDGSEIKVAGSLNDIAQPAKNTYYVMRHGQSIANTKALLDTTGDPNNHLTEAGIEGVKKSAEALKSEGIDMIFLSPFLRTKETAAIVQEVLGVTEVHQDIRLREFEMGTYDGKTIGEFLQDYGITYLQLDTRIGGGETHRDMMNRTMQMIGDLEAKYSGKKILIITHGGPGRMLIAGAELRTEEELIADERSDSTKHYLQNASVRKLDMKIVPRDETGAINLHRPYIDAIVLKDSTGGDMKRIPDVFDCWFESGSMPFASVHYPFENKELFHRNFPADFIAEGIDQTRGWFYSLINLGVGLFDKAPYKHVIVNGLVLAESGKKLSKSEKNYTDPMVLVEKFGADSVRYFLLNSPVVKGDSVEFHDAGVEEVYKKLIARLENVVTLYEMYKEGDFGEMKDISGRTHILDMWIVSRLHQVIAESTKGYETCALDEAVRPIEGFIDDLSVWYTRRSRDRLKGDTGEEDRVLAEETLTYVLQTLAKVIAPSMPFLAERLYKSTGGTSESVHLTVWPVAGVIDEDVITHMKQTREIVSNGLMKRTEAKIPVRQPLQSASINTTLHEAYLLQIEDELNVKEVIIDTTLSEGVFLDTEITDNLKTEGDMRKLIRAVQDARKAKNLTPKDIVLLTVSRAVSAEVESTCNVTVKVDELFISDTSVEFTDGKVYYSL
jgi:isoleucyl-tRNA synthetase